MTSIKSNLSNWRTVYIEDVFAEQENGVKLSQGWSPQCLKTPAPENSWGVLKTTSIQAGYFLESENKQLPHTLQPRKHLEVKEGDILITCAGPRNRCGVACLVKKTRKKLIISGKMYRFRANENIAMPEFIEMFLQTQRAWLAIDKMKTGGSDSGLNLTHSRFKKLEIPLPPLPEQHAIVSKIEELFSELENGKQQLQTALQQLKVYRQSLLKAAFEGKLTNKNVKDDELPEGWKWVMINDIGKIKGGKRLPPKHQYSEYPTEYVYIMAGNLKDGTVKNKTTYIKEETYNALSNYKVTGGEVYITIVGACIGDAGVIPENIGKSILTENAAKIIDLKNIQNKYLSRWINSFNCQLQIKRKILSATLGKLALNRIGTLELPLPPMKEQQLIVQELESKLTVCDKIEETITQSLQQAETLRQSILKQAFEGKLVEIAPKGRDTKTMGAAHREEDTKSAKAPKGRYKTTLKK